MEQMEDAQAGQLHSYIFASLGAILRINKEEKESPLRF